MEENKLALFEEKEIRREWYKDDWYFSVIDVVEVLVENNKRPRKYWSDLKQKLISEGFIEVSEKIGQLKMLAKDGKMRLTDEIYKSTFGLSTSQYKTLKGIENTKRNLRDSMGNLELAITNLAEVTANEIHNVNNSYGLNELKTDVSKAGKITGKAREDIEKEIGKKVADSTNYKTLTRSKTQELPN